MRTTLLDKLFSALSCRDVADEKALLVVDLASKMFFSLTYDLVNDIWLRFEEIILLKDRWLTALLCLDFLETGSSNLSSSSLTIS